MASFVEKMERDFIIDEQAAEKMITAKPVSRPKTNAIILDDLSPEERTPYLEKIKAAWRQ